jgi:hypothetical protein
MRNRQILHDRSFKLAILITFLFLGIGFAFLHYGLADYSWICFMLLPIVLGISIGALPSRKWAYYGAIISAVIFLFLLLVGGLEGFVCVIMAIPILIPFIFLGSVIVHLAKRYRYLKSSDRLPVLLLPLIPFLIAAPIERIFKTEKKQLAEVKTERVYPYTTQAVYDAIKQVDTLIADKPFLLQIGLPVPYKCVLENEAVNGIRTCYFSGGTITEKITELEKAKVLKMDIIDYQLTGRKWLGFKEAIYYFEPVGRDNCKLTRVTTYTSELTPRWYWQPLEKMGISQEHSYVFDNLQRDLAK